MAAKLNYIIPTQKFELIRDSIGVILATEIANQKLLTSNNLFDAVTYLERFVAFDPTELPAINVVYNDTKFTNQDMVSQTGENTYYIDVVTSAEDSSTMRGDKQASINCHKLLGVIRTILSAGEYRFLGLAQGIVQTKTISSISISQPSSNSDSLHVISGRLEIKIKANESNNDLPSIDLTEIFSNFTIEETNFGNKITILNN